MLSKLKQILAGDPDNKQMKPIHYFILLFCIGAAVMIFTDFLSVEPDQSSTSDLFSAQVPEQEPSAPASGGSVSNDEIQEYENMYETQLAEILETVIGVGQVEVMVNLDSTPEVVVEKNRDIRSATTKETDKDKATRNQTDQTRNEQVVVVQGSKQEHPVVLKTVKPKVRGVLVVAKGAENIQVKAWILEAVQKVLDVPAYKISVLPKKK
ncbi:stage III sporulation protein AG [Brevibacillus humidisoli]|uniref:stage III sporulation protein AG n=1 Tax=Brevibacillus humidisoli TaxID=2895522 RepID=UPI001E3478BD|nr:stage III sporulation protein AG [Brevibacillus humidisoli]UFJ42918.1 stage III sporulation protein AG [Brevibacillus humidisoli]